MINHCQQEITIGETLSSNQKMGLDLVAKLGGGRDVVFAIDLTESVSLDIQARLRLKQIISDSLNRGDSVYIVPFSSQVNPTNPDVNPLSLAKLIALFQSLELNNKLQTANKKLQSATPIVIDEKLGHFKFQSGSAELSSELISYINKQISPQISKIIQERYIDFIQVIGHTDGQIIGQIGNLDQNLEKASQNQVKVGNLKPASNADLGLMRALAVVQELQKQEQFKNVKFRAYSAAQLYLPSGELAPLNRKADEARRRIEIRFIPPGKNN